MSRLVVLRRIVCLLVMACLVSLLALTFGQADTKKGKKYALLVGVREYEHGNLTNLAHTENDVEELGTLLRKADYDEVVLLTTTRGKGDSASKPTVRNIRAALVRLRNKVSKHDLLLVALSGHGVQYRLKIDGKEKDEGFFCPADARPIRTDDIKDLTKTMLGLSEVFRELDDSGAGAKLLLVDACRNEPTSGRNLKTDALPRPPSGTAALFSCKSGERAFETRKLGKAGHGVFFHYVLEGLKGQARNVDGEVTWSGLSEYVSRRVSRDVPDLIGGGARQTPHEIKNFEGESPVLLTLAGGWDKEIENSIGMKLVQVKPGKFMMGSPEGEKDRGKDEEQHEVETTKPFWLGTREVTQKQFKMVMGYNPSYFSKDGEAKAGAKYYTLSKPAGGKDKVKGENTDDFPVENVSWGEAVEFCRKLTTRKGESGRKYRLPTETEWEYACRGGHLSRTYDVFHFGDSLSSSQANFNGEYPYGGADKGKYLERPIKVGSYQANALGLHDMHGNVWEWCSDWYAPDYYGKSPRRDPSGPSEGSYRVIRGGGWYNAGQRCRSANRYSYLPAGQYSDLGFRVALVPSHR